MSYEMFGSNPSVEQAVYSEKNARYAFDEEVYTDGVLKWDVLGDSTQDRVGKVAERVGWPTDGDNDISDLHYYTPDTLRDNIFGHGDGRAHLNNLLSYIGVVPGVDEQGHDTPRGKSVGEIVYGTTPALIRATALAPDLFAALRGELEGVTLPKDRVMKLDDDRVAYGVYMAYRIMGRLVTKDDLRVQSTLMGRTEKDLPDLSSAHHAVTA